jgi:hypothetical protein
MLFFMMMTIASKTVSKGNKEVSIIQITKPPGDTFDGVVRADVVVHGIGIRGKE